MRCLWRRERVVDVLGTLAREIVDAGTRSSVQSLTWSERKHVLTMCVYGRRPCDGGRDASRNTGLCR